MEVVWPNGVRMSSVDWRHVSNSEAFPALYGGLQTVERPGDRLGCTITVRNSKGDERAKLRAFAASLRGRTNRVYLPDLTARLKTRGTWATVAGREMFSNAEFADGTTGWTADFGTLTASDGVMTLTASQGGGSNTQFRQSVSLASYAPYVLRSVLLDGAQTSALTIGPSLGLSASSSASDYSTSRGYRVASGVSGSAASVAQFAAVISTTTGFTAGAYIQCPFTSLSRCALVDGGGTLTLRSREIDNASWTKNQLNAVGANTEVAPDGTTTGEGLTPNTSNNVHFVSQAITVTSSAQDLNIRGCFKAGGYNFVLLAMTEGSGSTQSFQSFNLGTGAVGATTATGGNWSNLRAAIVSLGNGWYYCSLVVRKTNAATSVTGFAYVENADSASAFTGNGTSFIGACDISLSASGSHARVTTSTSAAVAAATQSGSGIYVKGLLASQSGLLVPGDVVEVDKQIKMVTAPLNSDAAGCGYLQLDSPCARALANDTPVIVTKPMAKFYLANDPEYPTVPGIISDFVFEFEQDLNS